MRNHHIHKKCKYSSHHLTHPPPPPPPPPPPHDHQPHPHTLRICASVNRSALVQKMDCCLFCAKPLSKSMLGYCQLDPSMKFCSKYENMIYKNTYENFVCEMAAIYSRGKWVKAAHKRFTINLYSSIHFSIHSAICSSIGWLIDLFMVLFLDTQNCMLHIRRKCRDRFPRHQLQRKRIVIDPPYIKPGASRTCRDACQDRKPVVVGKTFPAFPVHVQPTILRIWQEAPLVEAVVQYSLALSSVDGFCTIYSFVLSCVIPHLEFISENV